MARPQATAGDAAGQRGEGQQCCWPPYLEKNSKDIAFDVNLDDFSALHKLNKATPTIFSCNGAECWKSYKAAKQAAAKGSMTVYWLRGGLPEWDEKGLPVKKN